MGYTCSCKLKANFDMAYITVTFTHVEQDDHLHVERKPACREISIDSIWCKAPFIAFTLFCCSIKTGLFKTCSPCEAEEFCHRMGVLRACYSNSVFAYRFISSTPFYIKTWMTRATWKPFSAEWSCVFRHFLPLNAVPSLHLHDGTNGSKMETYIPR